MTNFSIIIPNHNGAYFLANCLKSLHQAMFNCPNSQFEIIFIDNNSHDNSIEIFEKIIPKENNYRILLNSKNYGFAKSVNQGIEKAKYDWVVLLNNDLNMEPNWLKLISQEIKKNKNSKVASFFGTVLNKEGNRFESQGFSFSISGKAENISNGKIYSESEVSNLKPFQIFGAPASLVVYKKSILQKINSFDESFFAYLEDVDVALRLHNLKYQTIYVPKAISYHLGGGTSRNMGNIRSRLGYRNWFFIIIKNYSFSDFLKNFFQIELERYRNLSYFLKQTISIYKWKTILIFPLDFLKTIIEILINLPNMLNKRKNIQKLIKLNQQL